LISIQKGKRLDSSYIWLLFSSFSIRIILVRSFWSFFDKCLASSIEFIPNNVVFSSFP